MTNLQKAQNIAQLKSRVEQLEASKSNMAKAKTDTITVLDSATATEAFDAVLLTALGLPTDLLVQLQTRVAAL